jgi:putative transposase
LGWRRAYGGLKLDQARRLKDIERENDRLKKAVSELTLDKLFLNDGSCVRLRPAWASCLAIIVARPLRSDDVLQCLADLFIAHGPPEHIRSDNGPEFAAIAVREWLGRIGVKTLYIVPGSPWENGYCAIARASTPSSATNSSTAKSSRRCARLRC